MSSATRPEAVALTFYDCNRVGPGGTLVCSVQLGGRAIRGRFDPSPLEYGDGYLIPIKRGGWLGQRYALAYVDPETRAARVVSRSRRYMRLLAVEGAQVTFAPDVDARKRKVLHVAL
ncbi:hypothetical protein [Sphingomonas hengshuiensis]|uniref:hypothetical protein n=1 Tax=Sphingomonas hengshuiensis TaxID=1609977 RepID=UPI0012B7203E|nr:hypothetical protein [Sphingomonas hengshuiensis]